MPRSKIEWTDRVWNPLRGCSAVSEGCRNCYAQRLAGRFNGTGQPYSGLVRWTKSGWRWTGEVRYVEDKLEDPYRWSRPSHVFVNSMSDLFHESVPDEWIRDIFMVMGSCQRHTFQVLTKRALRMEQWFGSWAAFEVAEAFEDDGIDWPPPNIWVGVSVEDQATADDRIPSLLASPVAVRFVSLEPLLGEVDLTMLECPRHQAGMSPNSAHCSMCSDPGVEGRCLDGYYNGLVDGIDWVIVGCESGPKSRVRSMDSNWVRLIRNQCQEAGVPFFFKQDTDDRGDKVSMPLLDGRVHAEFPDR